MSTDKLKIAIANARNSNATSAGRFDSTTYESTDDLDDEDMEDIDEEEDGDPDEDEIDEGEENEPERMDDLVDGDDEDMDDIDREEDGDDEEEDIDQGQEKEEPPMDGDEREDAGAKDPNGDDEAAGNDNADDGDSDEDDENVGGEDDDDDDLDGQDSRDDDMEPALDDDGGEGEMDDDSLYDDQSAAHDEDSTDDVSDDGEPDKKLEKIGHTKDLGDPYAGGYAIGQGANWQKQPPTAPDPEQGRGDEWSDAARAAAAEARKNGAKADKATDKANAASKTARSPEEHEKAAKAHEAAAESQKKAGNHEAAEAHEKAAAAHEKLAKAGEKDRERAERGEKAGEGLKEALETVKAGVGVVGGKEVEAVAEAVHGGEGGEKKEKDSKVGERSSKIHVKVEKRGDSWVVVDPLNGALGLHDNIRSACDVQARIYQDRITTDAGDFDESQHPRDHGKFASAQGAAARDSAAKALQHANSLKDLAKKTGNPAHAAAAEQASKNVKAARGRARLAERAETQTEANEHARVAANLETRNASLASQHGGGLGKAAPEAVSGRSNQVNARMASAQRQSTRAVEASKNANARSKSGDAFAGEYHKAAAFEHQQAAKMATVAGDHAAAALHTATAAEHQKSSDAIKAAALKNMESNFTKPVEKAPAPEKRYTKTVDDYEHSGDLDHEMNEHHDLGARNMKTEYDGHDEDGDRGAAFSFNLPKGMEKDQFQALSRGNDVINHGYHDSGGFGQSMVREAQGHMKEAMSMSRAGYPKDAMKSLAKAHDSLSDHYGRLSAEQGMKSRGEEGQKFHQQLAARARELAK